LRRDARLALTIIVCALLGVTSAMIVKTMHDQGVIIDEFVTGSITLQDLQFMVFFLWLVVGIIVGVTG